VNSRIATPDNPLLPLNRDALVAALGVVFGDIGTSPQYALCESFGGEQAG
jgi:K+ transporter